MYTHNHTASRTSSLSFTFEMLGCPNRLGEGILLGPAHQSKPSKIKGVATSETKQIIASLERKHEIVISFFNLFTSRQAIEIILASKLTLCSVCPSALLSHRMVLKWRWQALFHVGAEFLGGYIQINFSLFGST